MTTGRSAPRFVLIDVANKVYSVYVGKTRLLKTKAEALLEPQWVETLRTRPDLLVDTEPTSA